MTTKLKTKTTAKVKIEKVSRRLVENFARAVKLGDEPTAEEMQAAAQYIDLDLQTRNRRAGRKRIKNPKPDSKYMREYRETQAKEFISFRIVPMPKKK